MSQTLNVIADQVRSCTDCRLHQGTRNGVPGEGNPEAEVMLVGIGDCRSTQREMCCSEVAHLTVFG